MATIVLSFSISLTFNLLFISGLFQSTGVPYSYFVIPLSVLVKPQCFSLFLLVRLIPTCCSVWICPIFLPLVLASFSPFPFICLFYDFLVFDPCMDFGLPFGILCFSVPLPQLDWLHCRDHVTTFSQDPTASFCMHYGTAPLWHQYCKNQYCSAIGKNLRYKSEKKRLALFLSLFSSIQLLLLSLKLGPKVLHRD